MATSRAQLILDQCGRLRELMREIPQNAPGLSRFNNRIVETENMLRSDVETADGGLQALLRDLRQAPDGMGGVILSPERFAKYLDRPGEV
jgi:hypothetical protein